MTNSTMGLCGQAYKPLHPLPLACHGAHVVYSAAFGALQMMQLLMQRGESLLQTMVHQTGSIVEQEQH